MKIDYKFIIVVIVLVLIWSGFMWYAITYGELVRKNPCSICSEKMGEEVICSYGKFNLDKITFFPNGSIE